MPRPIVLLAHGSPDARHSQGVEALAARVRALAPDRPVHTAYLDHHPPSPAEAADRARHGAVVPVLLTPAYHVRVDVPDAVASMNAAAAPSPRPRPSARTRCSSKAWRRCWPPRAFPPTASPPWCCMPRGPATALPSPPSRPRSPSTAPPTAGALDGRGARRGTGARSALAALPPQVERVVSVSFMVAEGVLRDRMAAACQQAGIPWWPVRSVTPTRWPDSCCTGPIACAGERPDPGPPAPARQPGGCRADRHAQQPGAPQRPDAEPVARPRRHRQGSGERRAGCGDPGRRAVVLRGSRPQSALAQRSRGRGVDPRVRRGER